MASPTAQTSLPDRLARDQRGAIMVIGLFMAVFLVAILYYAIGIGDAVIHRERMQDAVDAASLSAAVVHARGMNVIVLINMVMAALMAVLVGLKMIESLLIAAIILLSILSFFTGGSTAAAIPGLNAYRTQVNNAYNSAKSIIFPALEALHAAARGVRAITPVASEARVIDTVMSHYSSAAVFGLAIPPRFTLPTEDDKPEVLCNKAGEMVGDLVALPIEAIIPGAISDEIGDLISDATGDLAASLSSWFCGDGSGKLPDVTVKRDEKKPTLPARQECVTYGKKSTNSADYDEPKHVDACERAEKEEQESTPDSQGDCQFKGLQSEESLCEPYWVRANLARASCKPGGKDKPKDYSWQWRRIHRYYLKTATGWIEQRHVEESELRNSSGSPCSSDDWQEQPSHELDPNKSVPVCSDFDETPCVNYSEAYTSATIGTEVHSCYYTEVAQVLGCTVKVEETVKADLAEGDKPSEADRKSQSKRVTQKFQEGVELGSDDMQLRAVVIGGRGSKLSESAESGIKLATWGEERGTQGDIYDTARHFGRIAIAQAEYYFAGKEKREEWMWHMAWRARFKRFRMPDLAAKKKKAGTAQNAYQSGDQRELAAWNVEPPSTDASQACAKANKGGAGDECSQMNNDLDILNNLVVH